MFYTHHRGVLYKNSFTFIKNKLYDLISLNAIWYDLVLNVNMVHVHVHSINDFFVQRCLHDISLFVLVQSDIFLNQ